MRRRTLIQWFFSAAAALPLGKARLFAQPRSLSKSGESVLHQFGAVVLPSELGQAGVDDVVARFVRFVEEYRSGAEMSHGYGKPRKRVTPTIAVADYEAQLEALRDAARARGSDLAALDPADARSIVSEALAAARVDELPNRPDGRHIVADLLSFYFKSSEANDLCYRAKIGRHQCVGLDGISDPPPAL